MTKYENELEAAEMAGPDDGSWVRGYAYEVIGEIGFFSRPGQLLRSSRMVVFTDGYPPVVRGRGDSSTHAAMLIINALAASMGNFMPHEVLHFPAAMFIDELEGKPVAVYGELTLMAEPGTVVQRRRIWMPRTILSSCGFTRLEEGRDTRPGQDELSDPAIDGTPEFIAF